MVISPDSAQATSCGDPEKPERRFYIIARPMARLDLDTPVLAVFVAATAHGAAQSLDRARVAA
jgi:hypothetical protein